MGSGSFAGPRSLRDLSQKGLPHCCLCCLSVLQSKQQTECFRKHLCSYFFSYKMLFSMWGYVTGFGRALWEGQEGDHPYVGMFHKEMLTGIPYSLNKLLKAVCLLRLHCWVILRQIPLFSILPIIIFFPLFSSLPSPNLY